MDVQRFFAVRDTYSHAKLAAVLGATVVYVAAALMLRPIVGGSVLMAVAVPALLAAWSFGARAGLLAVLLGFLLNLLLVTAFVEEGFVWWLVHGGALSTVTLAGVALAVGHLRDVRARLESELLERRRLQGVVWRSDERLAAALGSMVDAVLTIDRRGRLTYLNPSAEHLFGYTRSEVLGKNVNVLMPEPYRAEHGSYLENYERTGIPKIIGIGREVRGRRKDGSTFAMELSVGELPDDEGSGFIGVARDVTARNRRQDAEHLLAGIVTNMAEGVQLIRARDGVIVYANERFEEMFGYDAGELIGKHVSVVNAPGEKSPEETAQEIVAALNAKGSWEGEIRNVKKDGTPFWSHASVSPFEHIEHGSVWVSVQQDITEQKAAAEALRDSEERYRILFEAAPVGIAISDGDRKVLHVNAALASMLGRTEEDLVGAQILDTGWDAEDVESRPGHRMHTRMAAGELDTMQFTRDYLRGDGTTIRAKVTASAVRDTNGRLVCVMRIMEDVTEQERVEEALRQSEEQYRALFESAPVGIAVSGESGLILQTNPALEKMLGRSGEELRGLRLRDLRVGRTTTGGVDAFRRLASGEIDVLRFEQQLAHSSGAVVSVHITITPVPSQAGPVKRIFRMVEDITERKEAARVLHEAQAERLERTRHLASIGELAAGVAHEINNPLNSVLGFAQLLMEQDLPPQAESDIEKIYAEGKRAAAIVANLLSFARSPDADREAVDLRTVIERACALKAYDMRRSAVEVHIEVPQSLPPVWGDEQRLVQVVLNILSNAEQAIAAASRPGVVTVSCSVSGGMVQIRVSDDGPGISPEVLGRIFEPFFTTKEVGAGTGLGLSVCQGIVRQHGGELRVESGSGAGATFFIELPVAVGEPPQPSAPAADPEPAPRMRVLVVDDEPAAREFMARALMRDDHDVETASDGADAWHHLQSASFDCVVVDLRMPRMGGQALYELAEETDPDMARRFIFVTGDTVSSDTLAFLASTPGPSLAKPVDAAELRRCVADLHEARRRGG